MKKRLIKKYANRYIKDRQNGRLYLPFGFYETEYQAYNDGTPPVVKIIAYFPWKIKREIWDIAFKMGWDGCHWDDPLLLAIDDSDKLKYEEEFHPPHTW